MKDRTLTPNDLNEAKKLSIKDYLEYNNIKLMRSNTRFHCLSPITHENTPSFVVYPENRFWDYSSGTGGDVVTLIRLMEGYGFKDSIKYALELLGSEEFDKVHGEREYLAKDTRYGKFDIMSYKANQNLDQQIILAYANKRGFPSTSYMPTTYKDAAMLSDGEVVFVDRLSVGFPHTDLFGGYCGIKMRSVDDDIDSRFSHRGKLGFYVQECVVPDWEPTLYIVESETSASSLSGYLRKAKVSSVVVSFGGIGNVPAVLPFKWEYLTDRQIIIDYDGNEELYRERLNNFKHLNAEDIKFELPKGQDVGWLCQTNQIKNYLP